MNILSDLILYSSQSVFTIIPVALVGTILVKYDVLKKEHFKSFSKLIFTVCLPCLLATNIAKRIDLVQLKELWILPFSCFVYVVVGLFLGYILTKFTIKKKDLIPGIIVTTGFGNTAYMPLSLIIAITAIFPVFAEDPEAAATGQAYISLYLILFSPLMWNLGFLIMSGTKYKDLSVKNLFPPPVLGLLTGVIIGLTPGLKDIFCAKSGFLYPLFSAAEILAAPTIGLALIVLGGNLANTPAKNIVNKKAIFVAALAKLILMPCFAMLYVIILLHFKIIPNNILLILILIIESAVPPATNTIIMSSLIGKNEDIIATILFWLYIFSIATITFFIIITMLLFSSTT